MTFSTNTNIAPIVNVDTYDCGPFSYQSLWQDDAESERKEGRFVCDDYSRDKMGDRIVAEANRVFDKFRPLDGYGVMSIKATNFRSPREYNFLTDWLDLAVEVDDSFWTKAKGAIFDRKNRDAMVKYAGEHWVSYDGFCSTMLNRLSELSRDTWKARNYGTHMATDREVETALMADLDEAFDHLERGTGYDDFREFGAVIALLWLVEYPGDMDRCRDPGDGWVAEEMLEHLRGNSSISEFCTVLTYAELYGKVGDALIDFDGFMRSTMATYDKYLVSGVGKASQARAASWISAVRKEVDGWRARQTGIVENNAPKWDEVRRCLDDLREEWEAKLRIGWPGAWK